MVEGKEIVSENADNTITFNRYRTWVFDESRSASLNDAVILPNCNAVKEAMSSTDLAALNITLNNENQKGFVNFTAEEFLNAFFFAGVNSTTDNGFVMNTGEKDLTQRGYLLDIPMPDGSCVELNDSTDGEAFGVETSDVEVVIYNSDIISRSLKYVYDDKKQVREIDCYDYKLSIYTYDTTSEAACFANPTSSIPKGAIFIPGNYPYTLSNSHFYDADSKYFEMNQIGGLRLPTQSVDGSFYDIHPKTGFAMQFKFNVQYNLYIDMTDEIKTAIDIFANYPTGKYMFPLYYVSTIYARDTPSSDTMRKYAQFLPILYKSLGAMLCAVGALLIVWAPIWVMIKKMAINTPRREIKNMDDKKELVS